MKNCEGFNFQFDEAACLSCNAYCCSGKTGYVWLQNEEISNIASYLKLSNSTFKKEYLKKIGNDYSIKELLINGSYECVFLTSGKCEIYEVRPIQCSNYPFWEIYKKKSDIALLTNECPGIIF